MRSGFRPAYPVFFTSPNFCVKSSFESSYWYGDNQTARTLFADHPELKTIFESTPDEVTAAWQRRMSLQPTH